MINIHMVLPPDPQEVVIMRVNWNDSIGIFKVHFDKLSPLTKVLDDSDCVVYGGIHQSAKIRPDAIVHTEPPWC